MKSNLLKVIGTTAFIIVITLLSLNVAQNKLYAVENELSFSKGTSTVNGGYSSSSVSGVIVSSSENFESGESGESGERLYTEIESSKIIPLDNRTRTIGIKRRMPDDLILENSWASSDESVAIVTNGSIIGRRSGHCTIYCVTQLSRILYCDVSVGIYNPETKKYDIDNYGKTIPPNMRFTTLTPSPKLRVSLKVSGAVAELVNAEGMEVKWSLSNNNLVKLTAKGNKATISRIGTTVGTVTIYARITREEDLEKIEGRKGEYSKKISYTREGAKYTIRTEDGIKIAESKDVYSDNVLIGVVGEGGFTASPSIQNTADLANMEFKVFAPGSGNYTANSTIVNETVRYAKECEEQGKDIYLYFYSSGGYQEAAMYEALTNNGVKVDGIIFVDAIPDDKYTIPDDVPVYIYGTSGTKSISNRTNATGQTLANSKSNVKYGHLNVEHGPAGGVGSVVSAAIDGKISSDSTVTQPGRGTSSSSNSNSNSTPVTAIPTTPVPVLSTTSNEIIVEGTINNRLTLVADESRKLVISVINNGSIVTSNFKIESNSNVITVNSSDRTIVANTNGVANLTIEATDFYKVGDSSTYWARKEIEVVVESPTVYMYDTVTSERIGRIFLNVGDVKILKAEIGSSLGISSNMGVPQYEWEVPQDSSKIISVNPSGVAVGRAEGEATIKVTATYSNGKVVYGEIKAVVKNVVNKIEIEQNSITIEKGKVDSLKVTTYPENADTTKLIWSSSDPRIAMVDGRGAISALRVGECVVTIYSPETGVKANAKVTVIRGENSHSYYSGSQFSNSKPNIGPKTYSDEDWDRMEKEFFERIEDAGFGTRAACVEAALYLASLDYAVPYRGTPMNRAANIGIYPKLGFNRGWGRYCRLGKTVDYNGKHYDPSYWAVNGMDCCGFVSWVMVNGGVKDVGFQGGVSPGNYTKTSNAIDFKDCKGIVQPGDLICGYSNSLGRYAHIIFVAGVDDEKLYLIHETGGKLKTTVSYFKDSNSGWKVVLMEEEYQKKNGTGNMPEVDW